MLQYRAARSLGVDLLPGAATGARIAVFVAIPVQFAADHLLQSYYRNFDALQRRRVNAAVEGFYGIDAGNEANRR